MLPGGWELWPELSQEIQFPFPHLNGLHGVQRLPFLVILHSSALYINFPG